MASDPDAAYDDRVEFRGGEIAPNVTWGTHPGQSVAVDGRVPRPDALPEAERSEIGRAHV